MENLGDRIQELFALYGLDVLAAIVILVVGRWVAKFLSNLTSKVLTKSNVDVTLVKFVSNLVYIGLLVYVIIAALGRVGLETGSFIAVLAAAGFAIGLALQGSLSNFAAGVMLILFKPFKVGDFIEGAGVAGVVEAVQLFSTRLKTGDNKAVIIPNAKMTSDNIVNYSAKDTRRVDMVFGIGYDDDLQKAKEVLQELVSGDERVLEEPAPTIAVLELADSSVNFAVRPWVKTGDYWGVYFGLTEEVKKRFDAEGISIPFPQRDVHTYAH